MSLIKLNIPPGVYRNATAYQASGRWYDTNLVRWIDGEMAPIGGWQKFSLTPVTGTCRGLFAWRDNASFRWLAAGTSEKLYVHDEGSLYDITPVGFSPGSGSSLPGLGYGALDYGEEDYGDVRSGTASLIIDAATWSFDSWGEHLVGCCTADGKIYEWSLNTATPAAVVANAPTVCKFTFVSEQRHLVALGANGDPRLIMWSDAENNTQWSSASTNQAGSWNLNTPGHLRCGVKARGETLLLTTADAHVMRFIGYPLIFSFERVGQQCGISSTNAAVTIDGGIAWFGNDARIYLYNGVVNQVPCDVQDWLESNFAKDRQSEVYGGTLSEQGEAWWFFPAADGAIKYVIWNYRTNLWSIGSLDRHAWLDRGVWRYPIAVSSDGYLYQQENGDTNSNVTRVGTMFAETGAMEIDPGERIVDILQILPDEKTNGDVKVTLKCRYTPNGTETTYGPYVVRSDGYTDVRASGRQAKIRVEPTRDEDWRVGSFRVDVKLAGKR